VSSTSEAGSGRKITPPGTDKFSARSGSQFHRHHHRSLHHSTCGLRRSMWENRLAKVENRFRPRHRRCRSCLTTTLAGVIRGLWQGRRDGFRCRDMTRRYCCRRCRRHKYALPPAHRGWRRYPKRYLAPDTLMNSVRQLEPVLTRNIFIISHFCNYYSKALCNNHQRLLMTSPVPRLASPAQQTMTTTVPSRMPPDLKFQPVQ